MSFDWSLIVVIGLALALGILVGWTAAVLLYHRAQTADYEALEYIDTNYSALHQHVHSTLGLKPPSGQT